jgi:hypothetical protein
MFPPAARHLIFAIVFMALGAYAYDRYERRDQFVGAYARSNPMRPCWIDGQGASAPGVGLQRCAYL